MTCPATKLASLFWIFATPVPASDFWPFLPLSSPSMNTTSLSVYFLLTACTALRMSCDNLVPDHLICIGLWVKFMVYYLKSLGWVTLLILLLPMWWWTNSGSFTVFLCKHTIKRDVYSINQFTSHIKDCLLHFLFTSHKTERLLKCAVHEKGCLLQ